MVIPYYMFNVQIGKLLSKYERKAIKDKINNYKNDEENKFNICN